MVLRSEGGKCHVTVHLTFHTYKCQWGSSEVLKVLLEQKDVGNAIKISLPLDKLLN